MSTHGSLSYRWFHSLNFKILVIFLILLVIIILPVSLTFYQKAEKHLKHMAYEQISQTGQHVIHQLELRTTTAKTLANMLVNLDKTLAPDIANYKLVAKNLLDYKGTEQYIAGGGIWPEPYSFDKNIERQSFFWGRDKNGILKFFDNYNFAEEPGYHHEEWYVPSKYLADDEVYWSKSYIDPYSLEPMVTVTSPIFKKGIYSGATTIDLNLKGLRQLLEQVTQPFGGYSFAIDRNGTFLSFPDELLAKKTAVDDTELTPQPYMTIDELAIKQPEFRIIAKKLSENKVTQVNVAKDNALIDTQFVSNIEKNINDIGNQEAINIAQYLSQLSNKTVNNQQFLINNDYFLQESVFVSIITMPETYWKIITVMPQSTIVKKESEIINSIYRIALLAFCVSLIIILYLIQRTLTQPIKNIISQLENNKLNKDLDSSLISTQNTGELNVLAYWFNQRTTKLFQTQEKMRELAYYDPLTGLANRRLLMELLQQNRPTTETNNIICAVLYIDIDRFKLLNDTLGHNIGDELLIQVADRINKNVGESDTVSRFGGDEFVVLLRNIEIPEDEKISVVLSIAEKILKSLAAPYSLQNHTHNTSSSIGISLTPLENPTPNNWLKQADTAMYWAKKNGKNQVIVFESEMLKAAHRRLKIEKDLRDAINNQQLHLVFQPQITADGFCYGAEALLRWQHPEEGFIPPDTFISIAEESNLIVVLGEWVLREACRQLNNWNNLGIRLPHLAVNISPVQFKAENFVALVSKTVLDFDILAPQLMLEITEGVAIDNINDSINKMQELKQLGFVISLDDFGTGYSSLTYLKQLPLGQLKIDRSFVIEMLTDVNSASIVKTIITMATQLGFSTIAEGVETREEADFLIANGCILFQGYYFSKPLECDAFIEFITNTPTVKS